MTPDAPRTEPIAATLNGRLLLDYLHDEVGLIEEFGWLVAQVRRIEAEAAAAAGMQEHVRGAVPVGREVRAAPERAARGDVRTGPRRSPGRRIIEAAGAAAVNEPAFDADGYPTDETLQRIETWDVLPTRDGERHFDFETAMDFAGRAWSYPDYWQKDPAFVADEYVGQKPQLRYVFSTGGWSGNESIVSAIEKNTMLQSLGAWSWRRGGHYEYRFPVESGSSKPPDRTCSLCGLPDSAHRHYGWPGSSKLSEPQP